MKAEALQAVTNVEIEQEMLRQAWLSLVAETTQICKLCPCTELISTPEDGWRCRILLSWRHFGPPLVRAANNEISLTRDKLWWKGFDPSLLRAPA
jgi:hypothetical protein